MVIRIRKWATFHLDDYLLILAVLCLISAFGIYVIVLQDLYTFDDFLSGSSFLPPNFIDLASNAAIYSTVAVSLSWATISLVKFSFLAVFRTLVRRLRPLEIWWWCTLLVCIPNTAMTIGTTWIVCPYKGTALICK